MEIKKVAVWGALVAWSCGSNAGDLMTGAGKALVDAGAGLGDGSASAQGAKNGERIEMRSRSLTGLDGSVYETPPAPYDTKIKEFCEVSMASDRTLRCMPSALPVEMPERWPLRESPFFADAKCSVPAVIVANACDLRSQYISLVSIDGDGQCGRETRQLHRLGKRLGPVYVDDGVKCEAQAPESLGEAYVLGEELKPYEFVKFEDSAAPR
jgi:hypothetical protein